MEAKITFGKFISQKRKAAGLTQKELAELLYVTESAVSKWERGVSYPDIGMVTAICAALGITEHELITASDDLHQRKLEKQAKSFRTIVKTYSWTFYLIYGLALLTCLICNLAVDGSLSWFFIVLTSIMVAFSLTCVPILAEKHRGIITLSAFFVSTLILLFSCDLYTGGDWFWVAAVSVAFGFSLVFAPYILKELHLPASLSGHKALISFAIDTLLLLALLAVAVPYGGGRIPEAMMIAAFTLPLAWIMMLVIRYLPTNGLFKASICTAVAGVYVFLSNSVISAILNHKPLALLTWDFSNWSDAHLNGNVTVIITAGLALAALLLLIGGIILQIRKSRT